MPDGDTRIDNGESDSCRGPTVIVIGNEKGGTGKTTAAVHVAIGLLYRGYRVATLDLDARQATLTRFLENRRRYSEQRKPLPLTVHRRLEPPAAGEGEDELALVEKTLDDAIAAFEACDIIVIDTPGSLTALSCAGHRRADILLTPLNESLFDIDVLAEIDSENRKILGPSFYCRMAWEYNNRRVIDGKGAVDWVIMRNRISHIHSYNRDDVALILERLAQRIGFRLAPGFGERMIFREHFLEGVTILDRPSDPETRSRTASHGTAREEIDSLLDTLGLPKLPGGHLRSVENDSFVSA